LEPLEAKRIKEYSSLEHLEGTWNLDSGLWNYDWVCGNLLGQP
jgi:hypothetical protein